MRYPVYWTQFAIEKLDQVYFYYADKVSTQLAQRIVDELIEKSLLLEEFPQTGQIEPLLLDRKEKFRYLIYKSYKLIYWINEQKERIEIINLFDCRQNPNQLMNQMKE
jgi:plasmid stabilization system protein ParE